MSALGHVEAFVATGVLDGTWTLLDHRYARINTDAVGFIVNIILHVRIYARFASDRAGRRSYEAHTRRTARSHRDPSRRAHFGVFAHCRKLTSRMQDDAVPA